MTGPRPALDDLDPYRVLEVHREARAEVIEAAFRVLREMACRDDTDRGARWLVELTWAHRVLTAHRPHGAGDGPPAGRATTP